MKVGIIGSGGREHAICNAIKDAANIKEIFAFLEMPEQIKLQKIFLLTSKILKKLKIIF